MLKLLKLLVLALVMILAACKTTPPIVTDVSCVAFGEITYSASGDTPQTIAEIRQHNAAWRALCKGEGK